MTAVARGGHAVSDWAVAAQNLVRRKRAWAVAGAITAAVPIIMGMALWGEGAGSLVQGLAPGSLGCLVCCLVARTMLDLGKDHSQPAPGRQAGPAAGLLLRFGSDSLGVPHGGGRSLGKAALDDSYGDRLGAGYRVHDRDGRQPPVQPHLAASAAFPTASGAATVRAAAVGRVARAGLGASPRAAGPAVSGLPPRPRRVCQQMT